MKHPMQKLCIDEDHVVRFRKNAIVDYLLNSSSSRGEDLNQLACKGFSNEDWMQFSQLIGYSVSGWQGLSYVSEKEADKAQKKVDELLEN